MLQPSPVLVVDDDRDLRTALALMLESEGHTVVEASHGGEAILVLTEARPHMVILDLSMPVMDGRAFLEHKAKTEFASIPVVVFSSSSADGIDQLPDVVSVVHKLAGVEALLAAVKKAADAIAMTPRRERLPRSEAFLTLQAQLLRLGVLEAISERTCSTCLLLTPLFRDLDPVQCLRCLGRARGFSFAE